MANTNNNKKQLLPRTFGIVEAARTPTHDFIDKLAMVAFPLAEQQKPGLFAAMKAKSKSHGVVAIDIGAFCDEPAIKDSPWHTPDVQAPAALVIQRVGKLDVSLAGAPFLCCGHFIVAKEGNLFVAVVPVWKVTDSEFDIVKWLDSAEARDASQCNCFILNPGNGLWIPPGHFALPITMDGRSEAQLRKDRSIRDKMQLPFGSFICYPILDKARLANDKEHLGYRNVLSSHISASPLPVGTWEELPNNLKTWRSEVEDTAHA